MAISTQEDLAKAAALIDQLRQLIGLVPPDGVPVDQNAPGGDSGGEPPADQFSTPALASSSPTSVPTIEPVDEAEVPDEIKAQDQAGQA